MTLKFKILALTLAVVLAFGAGWTARSWRVGAQQAKTAQAETEATRQAVTQANAADDAAALKTVGIETRQTAEKVKYVQIKVPVAPDCRLPDDAYGVLLRAVRQANAGAHPD